MSQRVVYLNGSFVREADARLSIYDSASIMGDAVFEVTRTFYHRPFRLRYHLERLAHSLSVLQIDPGLSLDELEALTVETLARNLPTEDSSIDWNIIHNISRGPARDFLASFAPDERRATVVISCYPLTWKLAALATAFDTGLDLVVPNQRALPGDLLDSSIKTRSRVHYQLATLQAQAKAPGAFAVLIDPDGFLTEGTSANIFLVRDGRIRTPSLRNVLPGVTRGLIFELAQRLGVPCTEANLTPFDAAQADEIFMTSTSIGVLHARSFEGKPVGTGQMGPITSRLRSALTAEVGVDIASQAIAYAQALRK
ncbi:MAG TPA: aminotransferase class IV [Pirellulales bacterium]|jgi:branched-chain amino acid aminotransferase|nr:aminotransferase class IV [Pirellulales bacterium]